DNERRIGAPPNSSLIAGQNQITGNLQLTVPLVNAPRWVQWDHADDNVHIAATSAVETRRQVALGGARAYLAVVTQHRVLEVNEIARKNAQDHLDFATTRLRGGVGNKLDQVRAGQELASVIATYEGARATLARAQETLGVIVAAEEPLDTGLEMP